LTTGTEARGGERVPQLVRVNVEAGLDGAPDNQLVHARVVHAAALADPQPGSAAA
jgi:hypothetical protein